MLERPPLFRVGDLPIRGDLVLAPMDGYSDWPFRSICRELGSAISYTEFVRDEDVLFRPHYIEKKIRFTAAERPVFFQLYGHDPGTLTQAALRLQEYGPDAIDLNLGCPNHSVTARGAGAGLLRTPLMAARIFEALSAALEIPLTAKIRLGWKGCWKGALIARIAETYGVSLLAVHARSKEQGHAGQADLPALAAIKASLQIPVIGNGGIKRVSDIQHMQERTGCEGVMIGRAAVSNPWIFSRRERDEVAPAEVQELMLEHLDRSLSFHGEEKGLVLFRKFAAAYLEPYQLDSPSRRKILTEADASKFQQQLGRIFQEFIQT
jgi:tRNA-dihydrouridine synthase B